MDNMAVLVGPVGYSFLILSLRLLCIHTVCIGHGSTSAFEVVAMVN